MASSHGEEGPPVSSTAASASTVAMPAKLIMASGHEGCRKEGATTMVVLTESSKNSEDIKPVPRIMDPWLLMAARKGDCKVLENLLVNNQVCQNDLKSFVIHMPEGASEESEESTDLQAQKVTSSKTYLLFHIEITYQPANGRDATLAKQQGHPIAVGESSNCQSTSSVAHHTLLDATVSSPVLLLDGVTLDSQGNSALHVVASSGDSEKYCDCAKLIYGKANKLLDAENNNGDTPLHCAARAGHHNMVSYLIELATPTHDYDASKKVKEFMEKKNKLGETALHGAVRSANTNVIETLMSTDPELANIPTDDGTSPLYLAISLRRLHIAWDLIQRSSNRLSYSGPDGQNVFHIAVFQGEVLSILLQKCKDVKVGIHTVPLLRHLTSQRDKNGSTPLHFAASLETKSSWYSRLSEKFWPKPTLTTLTQLLKANESMVYQPDNEGSYPIHVAACNGRLKAVMLLLRRYPECATLRDKRGMTFLHVAVEKKRHDVVEFVSARAEFEPILNEQDKQGETALHLAVKVGVLSIFNLLFQNRHVCLDLLNRDGLTSRDLSWIMIPAGYYNKKNPGFMIYQSLAHAGSAAGFSRPDHFYDKYAKKRDESKDLEYITSATQVVGLSSVLVATVTFAAAFTLPGGYRADDHSNGGTPTLYGSFSFDVFIISNTLAFICSLLSSASLLYSGVSSRDISARLIYYWFSRQLLHTSIRSLIAAFAMGMYVVLAPVAIKVAISVLVISFGSLLCGSENVDIWHYLVQANTFRVRFGILAARSQVKPILKIMCKRLWSYIIIFGLPAILKIH